MNPLCYNKWHSIKLIITSNCIDWPIIKGRVYYDFWSGDKHTWKNISLIFQDGDGKK